MRRRIELDDDDAGDDQRDPGAPGERQALSEGRPTDQATSAVPTPDQIA